MSKKTAIPQTYTLSDPDESVSGDSAAACDENSVHGSLPTELVDIHVDNFTLPSCCITAVPDAKYNPEQYERLLHESWLSLSPQISMPWDTANTNSIYGYTNVFGRPRPSPYPVMHKRTSLLEDELKGQTLAKAAIRLKRIRPKADTVIRSVAVAKWLSIINHMPSNFKTGRFLLSQATMLVSDVSIEQAVSDVVSLKSTRTLSKRAADMMRYLIWAKTSSVKVTVPTESTFYAYLSYLRQVGAAPGAFTAAKSALAFAGAVFGLDNALEVVNSPMIKGIVDAESLKKPKRKPKPPLTADAIRMLESIQLQSPVFADRTFAGFCLFATFGRLRFSDAQRIVRLAIDQAIDGSGYLEGVQDGSKTSTTVRKKNEFLPVAVPLCGLSSKQWAHIFVSDLNRAGLLSDDGDVVHQSLITCPGDSNLFTDRPLDSEQAKVWLQDLLISGGMSVSFCRSLGTHSMKSTTLSWCAKFGLSARTRKFLGYHVDRTDTSLAIYSRDLASKPLRQLCKVIQAVADRTFFPDSTRSGYFIKSRARDVDTEPNEPVWFDSELVEAEECDFPSVHSGIPPIPPLNDLAELTGDLSHDVLHEQECLPCEEKSLEIKGNANTPGSDSDSSFSNSSSSSDVSENDFIVEDFATAVSEVVPRNPAKSSSEVVYQHSKLGTLHLAHSAEISRLACGRAMSLTYKPVHSTSFEWPKCKVCFGSVTVSP